MAATYQEAGVAIPPYVRIGPSLTRNYTNKPHKKELFTSLWQDAVTIEQSSFFHLKYPSKIGCRKNNLQRI